MKTHITDYAVWGPIPNTPLKNFYNEMCSGNLECTYPGSEMNLELFLNLFNTEI